MSVGGLVGLEVVGSASMATGDNGDGRGRGTEVAGRRWWRGRGGRRAAPRGATGRVLDGDEAGLVVIAGVAMVRRVGGRDARGAEWQRVDGGVVGGGGAVARGVDGVTGRGAAVTGGGWEWRGGWVEAEG